MAWLVDDGRLTDDDVVYRRLLRRPGFFVPRDTASGHPTVTNASLQYTDDGMSVYSGNLLAAAGLQASSLYNAGRYDIARFSVAAARRCGLGLVAAPDDADKNIERGSAHVVVRTYSPPPDRREWTARRVDLRRDLEVLNEESWTWDPLI